MTFPTIPTAGASRILSVNQANTTATRTFPNLSSLTKNSGDLLIAIVFCYQTGTGTNAAFSSWGGSFTEFHDSATSTTMAIGCAYKWSTGSETGTFSVTQAGAVTGHAAMILLSIPGAHLSTPPEAGGRASGVNSTAQPGALNPAGWDVEDTLWITVGGSGETATTGSFTGMAASDPTNYTDNFVTGVTGDVVGGVEGKVAFRQLAAASETPPTFSNDTSNARWGALTIAVRPAPSAVTGAAVATLGGTATAAGIPRTSGSAAASLGGTATAAGHVVERGAAATSFGGTFTAAGIDRAIGQAVATFGGAFTASGEAGASPVQGQAAASFGGTATASGKPTTHGVAATSLGGTATASGIPRTPGAANASFGPTATVAGRPRHPGTAVATLGGTGTSSGVPRVHGVAAAAFGFTATTVGIIGSPAPPDANPVTLTIRGRDGVATSRADSRRATARTPTQPATRRTPNTKATLRASTTVTARPTDSTTQEG